MALKLSKSDNMRAWEFSQGIKEGLSANLGDQFLVHLNPPGLIQISVSDKFIANWLDSLANLSFGDEAVMSPAGLALDSPTLFTAQYFHARCCSLLRLGEQEGLIKLGKAKHSILWLDEHQKIRCDRQTTRHLIYELVHIVDWLYNDLEVSQGEGNPSKKIKWEKNVVGLINAFAVFWADCRIWGKVKSTSPELARMRLGLILATRVVLKLLLEHLGLAAPESI